MKNFFKQPNGKYCKFDISGGLKFYNYTEQDVIDMYINEAKKDMQNAEHYGKIIELISYNENRRVSDYELESMGFNKHYNELVKFIPRMPNHQQYAACDFATYGDCPNCGKGVKDGIGGRDEKCRWCGQMLKWD